MEAEPFASGEVPVAAAEMSCKPVQSKAKIPVTSELVVVEAPSLSFVRFGNAVSSAEPAIRAAISANGAKISTVLADGSPKLALSKVIDFSESFVEADDEKQIAAGLGKVRQTYYCAMMQKSQNGDAFALVDGTDFLQALHVAEGSFVQDGAAHEILVIGNGLQDVGQMDLTANFPKDIQSAENYARNLASQNGLPNLKGVKVSWYGLGQTAQSSQEQLHPAAAAVLKALWTSLIEEAGGELITVVENIPYADPLPTSIKVKSIAVPEAPCAFMLTSDDGFNFKPDSAEFLDAAKARKGAENMAAEIEKSECSGPLYVVGYAASGVDKKQYNSGAIAKVKSLSAARAAAFKGLLEQSGVKIKLVPVGAGKGPTTDWDLNGKFVEEIGKQNRFVEVTQSKPEAE
ncbi:MAG: hypothetical protein RL645_1117 [Actinomycetota bacterium]|jgi:outer membrane protein OmpA-like peptidoglycan-associated protein